jgi:hypothetical protein
LRDLNPQTQKSTATHTLHLLFVCATELNNLFFN